MLLSTSASTEVPITTVLGIRISSRKCWHQLYFYHESATGFEPFQVPTIQIRELLPYCWYLQFSFINLLGSNSNGEEQPSVLQDSLKLFLTLLQMNGRKLGRTKSKAESCIWRTGGIKRCICSCLSEEHSHSYSLAATMSQSLDICSPAVLIHADTDNLLSVFYSNLSSCQAFFFFFSFSLIIYSSLILSLLFLLPPAWGAGHELSSS